MKVEINLKNYEDVKSKLKKLHDDFELFYEKISSENPSWNLDDARFSLISKPMNVIAFTMIGLEPIKITLQNAKWFTENFPEKFPKKVPLEVVAQFHDAYDAYLRRSFISDFYGSFESSFRLIAGPEGLAIIPTRSVMFSRTYPQLFRELELSRHTNLMVVWGIVRNAIHSNSIYNPPGRDPQNLTFQYKGKKRTFKVGKPIKKSSWDELFTYCSAYLELLEKIFSRNKIKNMNELLETSATFQSIGPTEEEVQNLIENLSNNDS